MPYFNYALRQHRIIQVCGLRSKIFRQSVQIISMHTDVWMLIFGQSVGIIFKQGVHRELCGVALIIFKMIYINLRPAVLLNKFSSVQLFCAGLSFQKVVVITAD